MVVRKKDEKKQIELNNLAHLQKMEERNSTLNDTNQQENNEEQNAVFDLHSEQNPLRNSNDLTASMKKNKQILPTSTFALADKMAEDIREKEI